MKLTAKKKEKGYILKDPISFKENTLLLTILEYIISINAVSRQYQIKPIWRYPIGFCQPGYPNQTH